MDILSDQYRNVMIVGDPDQNIYEWRGSDVKLLVDFDKNHEPTRTIILNQNYRSTEFKNKQSRRANFMKKKWKQSKKGNEYLKTGGHVIVLYQLEKAGNKWKYSIDNTFGKNIYAGRDKAVAGVFEALEELRGAYGIRMERGEYDKR